MSTSPTPFTFDGHGINDANGERIIKVQFPRYDQNGENLEFVRLSTMIAAMPQMARAITIALVALNTINPETGNRIHQDAGLTNISNALSAVAGLMIGENNVAEAQHWLNQAERVPVIPR